MPWCANTVLTPCHAVPCCAVPQVILYEMGSGSTQAALIKYSTYGKSKSSQTNQFEVLDVAYDHSLGSNSLDLLLLKHFADEFKQKGGDDIRCVLGVGAGLLVCLLSLCGAAAAVMGGCRCWWGMHPVCVIACPSRQTMPPQASSPHPIPRTRGLRLALRCAVHPCFLWFRF